MSNKSESGRPSPETPVVDPAIKAAVGKATELQEVKHNGFVGNWGAEEKPPAKS